MSDECLHPAISHGHCVDCGASIERPQLTDLERLSNELAKTATERESARSSLRESGGYLDLWRSRARVAQARIEVLEKENGRLHRKIKRLSTGKAKL